MHELAVQAAYALGVDAARGVDVDPAGLSDNACVRWSFVRGLFDAAARVAAPRDMHLVLELPPLSGALLGWVLEVIGSPPGASAEGSVRWEGAAALDVLGHVYDDSGCAVTATEERPDVKSLRPPEFQIRESQARERYLAWCQRVVGFEGDARRVPPIRVRRVHQEAILPSKERVSDSGYDLTLLYEKKRFGSTILCGTGLIVEPPDGWYLDVVARSSIIKLGYMLANNVGIIDRAYRGELFVPVVKIDAKADDLTFPVRLAQMIPRPVVHFEIEDAVEVNATHRGAGGFGSSG